MLRSFAKFSYLAYQLRGNRQFSESPKFFLEIIPKTNYE